MIKLGAITRGLLSLPLLMCIALLLSTCMGADSLFSEIKTIVAIENGFDPNADTTPPAEVSNLQATPGDGEVVLTWNDPINADFDHVEITWSPGGPTLRSIAAGVESFAASGLTNGTSYTFEIVTVDTSDNESDGVNRTVTPADTIGPADVSNLQASVGNGEVTFTWDDPEDSDLDHVEITWAPGGSIVQIVSVGTETYAASGLTNDTSYSFTIVTVDASDNESGGVITSATPVASTGPANVSDLVAAAGDGEVVLTWNDPGDGDFDHVEITWLPGGSAVQLVSAGTETYTAIGLTNGTSYTFTIVTVDTSENESGGVITSATPVDMTGPSNVTNLQATAGNGEVVLTWNDPDDGDFDHVEITWTPDGSTPQLVSSGVESYTATGLTNGTSYIFTVVSVDGDSNPSSGVTVDSAPGISTISFIVDLPNQPSITFSGELLILPYGTDMTVTVEVAEQDSITWYLDGSPVDTGTSITIGFSLGAGPYDLTALVQVDEAYYSETISFRVESTP